LSHKRIPKRKAAIAAGSVAALGAAALFLPNAMASQTDSDDATASARTFKAADVSDLAAQLASQLGDAFAGSYYDAANQQIVINVVGDNSNVINEIRAAGAVPNQVRNSTDTLENAAATLKSDATIPGTAWSVDPKTNEIRVTADSTVTGFAQWALPAKMWRLLSNHNGEDAGRSFRCKKAPRVPNGPTPHSPLPQVCPVLQFNAFPVAAARDCGRVRRLPMPLMLKSTSARERRMMRMRF